MEEDDKGCPMIMMGVNGWMFLLVPAYPGSPGQKAVKRLCVCVLSQDYLTFIIKSTYNSDVQRAQISVTNINITTIIISDSLASKSCLRLG